jgi:hypothetical protein
MISYMHNIQYEGQKFILYVLCDHNGLAYGILVERVYVVNYLHYQKYRGRQ